MANTSDRGFGSIDEDKAREIRSKGEQASSEKQDMSKIGQKGGQASHQSGNAHELTDEERSEGGKNSGGNFKNDPQRASEAGKIGGSR